MIRNVIIVYSIQKIVDYHAIVLLPTAARELMHFWEVEMPSRLWEVGTITWRIWHPLAFLGYSIYGWIILAGTRNDFVSICIRPHTNFPLRCTKAEWRHIIVGSLLRRLFVSLHRIVFIKVRWVLSSIIHINLPGHVNFLIVNKSIAYSGRYKRAFRCVPR